MFGFKQRNFGMGSRAFFGREPGNVVGASPTTDQRAESDAECAGSTGAPISRSKLHSGSVQNVSQPVLGTKCLLAGHY